jgi:uncharacterized membrane protein YccC
MRASLLLRLREIVDVRQDLRDLRRHIAMGGGPLAAPLAYRIDAPARQHRDRGIALLSGLSAFLTILAICAFWIGTGWPDGAGAAQLGAVACCLFATLDDPTPAQKKFMFAAVLGLASVGVGLFGVLPLVHDFETLAFALGVFFVPVGVMMAVPATQPLGTAIALLTATLLAVQSTYAADFPSYANGGIASLLGLGGAAVMTALVRSVGAEWSARRLLRAIWRDLAAIPRHPYGRDRASLSALLLDRLGLLVPRLAAVGQGNELAAVDALRDLRIGINMADLCAAPRGRGRRAVRRRLAFRRTGGTAAGAAAAAAAARRDRPCAGRGARRPGGARPRPAGATRRHSPRPVCPSAALPAGARAGCPALHPRGGGGMIGEFDVYGVFVPALLVWWLVALVLTAVLRRGLAWAGFYRLVWHRPLVDLSLLVILFAAVAAVASGRVAP